MGPAFLTKVESDHFLADLEWDDPATDASTIFSIERWTAEIKQTMNARTREELQEKLYLKQRINSEGGIFPTTKGLDLGDCKDTLDPSAGGGGACVKKDFLWIHIVSLAALDSIMARFGLHSLVITGFRDIRSSANFCLFPEAFSFAFVPFGSLIMRRLRC